MNDASQQHALFAEVINTWQPALKRLCAGYEFDPDRQRDLLQEILLVVWRALPSFRGKSSLRTWMYRVAHNVAATHSSRSAREPALKGAGRPEDLSTVEHNPEVDVDRHRTLVRLRTAIRQLGSLDRQIILLFLEELPQQEIAEITGLSRDNISTRVHRVKSTLAQQVSGV